MTNIPLPNARPDGYFRSINPFKKMGDSENVDLMIYDFLNRKQNGMTVVEIGKKYGVTRGNVYYHVGRSKKSKR